jgi:two-component system alkaline phosphatase synthesis response regulator PhoP
VDDYLTKPFEIEELIARLKSILKRKDKQIDEEKNI